MRHALLVMGMLPLLLLPARASKGEPPPSVRLLVSNAVPYTGEEVALTMEVSYVGRPSGRLYLRWPALDAFAAGEMRALPPLREAGSGRVVETQRRALRPLAPGRYPLEGGVSLGGHFIAAVPLTLRVRPLPVRGRPEDFRGAVGEAELQLLAGGTGTREVEVVLRGDAPLDAFPSPEMATGRGERLVPLGEEFSGNPGEVRKRIFRYLYLPGEGRRGDLSVSLSLFEPVSEKYRRLGASLASGGGVRIWPALLAGAALLGSICLIARRRGRRPRDLETILEQMLGRSPDGLCRDRIRDELSRAGLPDLELMELMRLWEMEDRLRYAGRPPEKTPDALRKRVTDRLRNAVDKSRPIP